MPAREAQEPNPARLSPEVLALLTCLRLRAAHVGKRSGPEQGWILEMEGSLRRSDSFSTVAAAPRAAVGAAAGAAAGPADAVAAAGAGALLSPLAPSWIEERGPLAALLQLHIAADHHTKSAASAARNKALLAFFRKTVPALRTAKPSDEAVNRVLAPDAFHNLRDGDVCHAILRPALQMSSIAHAAGSWQAQVLKQWPEGARLLWKSTSLPPAVKRAAGTPAPAGKRGRDAAGAAGSGGKKQRTLPALWGKK